MSLTTPTTDLNVKAADTIRILSAAMVEKANSGHPGGAMGGADFMHVLFSEYLNYDPENTAFPFRDRFFLDPGHMSAMLYSQYHLLGYYSTEDLQQFRQWGSPTPGHPERDIERGIENTSGPLGLGQAFGIGAAIAERFLVQRFGEWMSHRTFIYISDGGIQEEISQGTARTAGFLGLGNVIMFYDSNDVQLSSKVGEVMREDTAMKYESWGWHVVTIDGNDQNAIRKALDEAIAQKDKPTLIIGQTVMGKGARTESGEAYEGMVDAHGKPLGKTGASFEATVKNLGGDPEKPFHVDDAVKDHYNQVREKNKEMVAAKRVEWKEWAGQNEALAKKLDHFLTGELPDLDFASIEQKPGAATRNASGTVLAYLADNVENMIVSSADLSNSDKTDAFLKKTTSFTKGDFSGSFLQAGVSEFSMSAMATGMALHGGVIPACATFFVFSDFMKPAIRLAALMEQNVIFIWTHDAFRVGEDGPTHQPVEQEAQIRLMEKLKNHHGENSFLALRPADVNETTVAWKMALEAKVPAGLILSRQNITNLPDSSYDRMLAAEKGGYIVTDSDGTPDVILLANGSEVATLAEGAKLLKEKKNLNVKLVSVPSEGRFRNQSKEYQDSVINPGVPAYGLTAGLPVNLEGLAGANGRVDGLDHFGYSAPYTVLDEKFGFTAEHVFNAVSEMLG